MLRVLTYHRVTPSAENAAPSLISASPADFEFQMSHLARHYSVVTLAEVLRCIEDNRSLPTDAVLITFDDAYRDFQQFAWPVLKKYRLPVTLFVPTAYPDRMGPGFWWDRVYGACVAFERRELHLPPLGRFPMATPGQRQAAFRQLSREIKLLPHHEAMQLVARICEFQPPTSAACSVLGWEELRQLAREGVCLCAHTRTHPRLTQLPLEEARREISQSHRDLQREIGATLPAFCYPDGAVSDEVEAIVRSCGFKLALTTEDGHNNVPGTNPLRLRRTNITPRSSGLFFRMRLWPGMGHVDRLRHGLRPASRSLPAAARNAAEGVAPPRQKLAYIMSRFPKLSETFVFLEILALESLGAAVEIYPLLRERQPVAHPEVAQLVRRAHFHPFVSIPILRAQSHYLSRQPMRYLKSLGEVLRGTFGSANFFFGAMAIFPKCTHLAYEIQRAGITHVHAHFANHPALAALIIHRLTGIPFSFTAHGSDLHVERRMLDRKVEAASFVVTVSDFNRELTCRECEPSAESKVIVLHCGVDTDYFAPRAATPVSRPLQIICVASFEEVKGHRFLLQACHQLRSRGVDFQCHLVGDGPLREEIDLQVRSLALRGLVHSHGAQPRARVAELLHDADIAALAGLPTRSGKREGIPVALMEAMASGLPVVASAMGGIPELVTNGENGLLVTPGDVSSFADALEKLAFDPDLRVRMGQAARQRIVSDFNLRTSAAKLLELFSANAPLQAETAVPSEYPVTAEKAHSASSEAVI